MSELLERIGEWIQQIIGALGYPGIFIASFAENVFPPIPSELIMPFGGFLAGRGDFSALGVIAAGTAGTVLGAVLIYYIGVWVDGPVIRGFLRRYGGLIGTSERDLDRAMALFQKYGYALVFFGRLIPVVRTIISLPAGMNRMPLLRFLFFTTLGSTIWSALLTYAGVLLGENWEEILVFMKIYERGTLIAIGTIALFVVLLVGARLLRSRRAAAPKIDAENV
jgi:membrane protein DedA with SNARE-associated domain